MLQIKKLRKSYYVMEEEIPVLNITDCTINKGEFVAILGSSGCGKTTFLNIISGLDQTHSGEIIFEDKPIHTFTGEEWDRFRMEHIGFVFQDFNLIAHLTALENVKTALRVAGIGRKVRNKRAKELLHMVQLGDRMRNKPNELSGGEKQRVAIARALANNPDIIIADEPTGALDSKTSADIMDILNTLNKEQGVTIIMVTHNEEIAAKIGRNISMIDGEIIEDLILFNDLDEKWDNKKEKDTGYENMEQNGAYHLKLMDSFTMAFKNIFSKKKRSILTMLGISVGIFSLLIIFGMANGISTKVFDELNKINSPTIINVIPTDEEVMERLTSDLMEHESVVGMDEIYTLEGTLVYKDKFAREQFLRSYGSSIESDDLLYGRYPVSSGEIMVTKTVAEKFLGKGKSNDLIGENITIYASYLAIDSLTYSVEREYEVVGIASTNLVGLGHNYITFSDADEISNESTEIDATAQTIFVQLKSSKSRSIVIDELTEKGYKIAHIEEVTKKMESTIDIVNKFMLLIVGISLAVAVVMVIIVQYMSVAEKVREIGILRAIGAKRRDVKKIFLLEALLMGMFAAVVGIWMAESLGSIINGVIKELMKESAFYIYQMNSPVLIGAFIGVVTLCLLAGYFPAKRAASVHPIEVLR